jgi:hypothetical protein
MKKKLITATVFVFGVVLGGVAGASGITPSSTAPSITPEMAQCIHDCQAAGGTYNACWSCCVQNICPVPVE